MSHEERIEQIKHQVQDLEDRQLESTERMLDIVDDSERIGNAAARSVAHQGEQLNAIERNITGIHEDLKDTQRHIAGIKSIFGGIKNRWNGEKDKDTSSRVPKQGTSKLKETIEQHNAQKPHPGERLRTDDGRGFCEPDAEFMKDSRNPQYFKPVTQSRKEKSINTNLDLVSDSVSRLKELAVALGDEIGSQNIQLDRITGSVDISDVKLKDQTRQIRGILK